MCGVAGMVSVAPSTSVGESVRRLTEALSHRGPDGVGYWRMADGHRGLCGTDELSKPADVVLGHRRLSIVDLEGGAEPMASEDGGVWLVFNGEIYNHLELRRELEAAGHRYKTHCDAETVVHGWEEWGEDLFGRLNGIFAFALADARRQEVLLVRDPLGVKPLYVGLSEDGTWFSSELAAAAEAGLLSGELSPDALKLYLTFRFVPSPHTIYARAWKVPPGHFARVRLAQASDDPEFTSFRCLVRSSAAPRGMREWEEALIAELDRAVERQLMADVPVASLLSGGVDSSLVTQMMAAHLPYSPLALGIGMRSEGAANEVFASTRAAEAVGVPHEQILVDDHEYVSAWPGLLRELGEPIANSSALLVRMICEVVGRSHKVALCGQGADELFGGYPRHMTERLYGLGRLWPAGSRAVARRTFGEEAAARLNRALSASDRTDRYVELFSVLPAPEIDQFVRGATAPASELARTVISRWADEDESGDAVNDLLRIDARLSLSDDLLIIGDHCAMRSSVELRVPFLDLALVDLVERMPSRYKVSTLGERKWLYRRAAARRLPPVLARELCPPRKRFQQKRGFSHPLTAWFDEARGLLGEPERWAAPLFDQPSLAVDRVKRVLGSEGERGMARRRSLLYCLAEWLHGRPEHVEAAA
jgi:asparagine synthase (glutamine-hydrolysing)